MSVVPLSLEESILAAGSGRAQVQSSTQRSEVLQEEDRFYREYEWCLNPCLKVQGARERLQGELAKLQLPLPDWQRQEVMSNVYLLACSLLNSVDDYLRGPVFQLPRLAARVPFARLLLEAVETCFRWSCTFRLRRTEIWRRRLLDALTPFLRDYCSQHAPRADSHGTQERAGYTALAEVACLPLPSDLEREWTHIPSAFRKLDLTPWDILELAQKFVERYPDRSQPVLAAGLRTAGSYFAPLFSAYLANAGYETIALVTFRPDRGLGRHEKKLLRRFAQEGYLAAVLDDPPVSGETFAHAGQVLHRFGFPADRVVALFPEQATPERRREESTAALASVNCLSIEPHAWHKARALAPGFIEGRLADYFHQRGYTSLRVVTDSGRAAVFNHKLDELTEDPRRTRLKRVFEVCVETAEGTKATRFVLAKSVGWGYLSYHAFLVGRRLAGLVPPLLGLRDGILFSEWLPQPHADLSKDVESTHTHIHAVAAYIAARVRCLTLPASEKPHVAAKHDQGTNLLIDTLCRTYGSSALGKLMRRRVRCRAVWPCPYPALIDGRMRAAEWLQGADGLLKTDYEHHGIGKNELNVLDPATDLAQAILHLSLNAEEEERLLAQYMKMTRDKDVGERLFIHKFLAGVWSMKEALRNLEQPHLAARQQEFHSDYVRAWDFLAVQTARHCGRLCQPTTTPSWKAPVVFLDVDGVLDRRIFGFPCTTATGIEALTCLHAHGLTLTFNSARSVGQMRAYCRAYRFAGAVAEYGSYAWDEVNQRGQALVSPESLRQIDRARTALRRLPGVFLNDGYEYSIRACTYEDGGPVPLPTLLVRRLFADEKLDRLAWHQTSIDSTIVAGEVNKGTGLNALLDFVGLTDAKTYAVGDSEPDLAMFRRATKSFAPAQIHCKRMATFLGCRIAPQPFQRGLLHIARTLAHADGGRCPSCPESSLLAKTKGDLFFDMLRVADQKRSTLLLRALLHFDTLSLFVR